MIIAPVRPDPAVAPEADPFLLETVETIPMIATGPGTPMATTCNCYNSCGQFCAPGHCSGSCCALGPAGHTVLEI